MKTSHLSARPIPRADESPASILIRAAERNGYESVHNMIHFTGLNEKSMCLEILLNYLAKFLKLLGLLGLRSISPEEILERGGPASKTMRRMMHNFYPPEFFRQDGTAYCPGCLNDQQYLRKIWVFRPYSICHIHGTPIITECTNCGKEMNISRGKLCVCSYCKSDIRLVMPTLSSRESDWIYDFLLQNHHCVEQFTVIFGWAKTVLGKDGAIKTDAEALAVSYLYFSDRCAFGEHLLWYVSSDPRHIKLKLLPLYRGSIEVEAFVQEFLERHKSDMDFSSDDLATTLTIDEAAKVHGLTTNTIQNLMKRNGKYSDSVASSLTVGLTLQLIQADIARKKAIQLQNTGDFLTITEVAERLNVHSEIVRSTQKSNYLVFERRTFAGSLKYVTTLPRIEEFEKQYVLVGTLARKLGVNATDLTARLAALGINPIATQKNSALKTPLFSASDVGNLSAESILAVQKCATNAGRKRAGVAKKQSISTKNVTITDAATQLNLSVQKVKILLERGHLTKAIEDTPGVFVDKASLKKLIQNLNNEKYISTEEASRQLNTSIAGLKREWISLGLVEFSDFIYWERVKKLDIDRILELKSEYVNATEAGALLGMHRTHVRNLAKQKLITPHVFGTVKKNRLYKISDVLKFK